MALPIFPSFTLSDNIDGELGVSPDFSITHIRSVDVSFTPHHLIWIGPKNCVVSSDISLFTAINRVLVPPAWYLLLFIVALCGVAAWYVRNFTTRVELLRVIAGVGICSMLALVWWTWEIA